MKTSDLLDGEERLAEAVRDACLEAALNAYEDASMRGVCHEGAWECAVGAIRSLDIEAVVEQHRKANETR